MRPKTITPRQSIGLLAAILAILLIGCNHFKLNSQVMLLCCGILAAAFARYIGYRDSEIEQMITSGISKIAAALLLNLFIGMLISTWVASGTVSYFIYICIQVVRPRFFLTEAFLLCCAFSALTGSCWICAGTIGLVLFYLSSTLQINPCLLAGAIVGGSRFGACISPISDSANVSKILSGVEDIYDHIQSACKVMIPAAAASAITYFIIDLVSGGDRISLHSTVLQTVLDGAFLASPVTLIPVVALCTFIFLRKSALLCLLSSIFSGCAVAVLLQKKTWYDMVNILFYGYGAYINSDESILFTLFSRGGIASMSNVLFTLIIGMSLSGILDQIGALQSVVGTISEKMRSFSAVVFFSSLFSVLGYGATGDSQPAKVLVSSAFSDFYEQKGAKGRAILSRSLEMSAFGEGIFPWTVGGVYLATLFGMPVSQYWYCIFFYYYAFLFNVLLAKRSA